MSNLDTTTHTTKKMSNRKQEKPFSFQFHLQTREVRNLRIVPITVGFLEISGTSYFYPSVRLEDFENGEARYEVDIDFIKWDGVDIKPVVEGFAEDLFGNIYEAAVQYASHLFSQNEAA
jgi:hypothetical protein